MLATPEGISGVWAEVMIQNLVEGLGLDLERSEVARLGLAVETVIVRQAD